MGKAKRHKMPPPHNVPGGYVNFNTLFSPRNNARHYIKYMNIGVSLEGMNIKAYLEL